MNIYKIIIYNLCIYKLEILTSLSTRVQTQHANKILLTHLQSIISFMYYIIVLYNIMHMLNTLQIYIIVKT